jgi:raffinose/stachyose/melibiose transport system permease protein
LYATLILMTVPSIIIYFFSQRYMQEGLTAGALKG